MKKLKAGDSITVVFMASIIMCEAHDDAHGGFFRYTYAGELHVMKEDLEGTQWLRGYHLPDSSEVRGARTALALMLSEQKETEIPATASQNIGTQILHGALVGALGALISNSLAKKGK